eukprot:scaffold4484_cov170-Amphora_coffeaeformis.AAC.4
MLGPDIELLTEINHDLGKRHVRYGVKPEMYEFMGEALVYTLEKLLGDDFKPEVREAWNQIYIELSDDINMYSPSVKRQSKRMRFRWPIDLCEMGRAEFDGKDYAGMTFRLDSTSRPTFLVAGRDMHEHIASRFVWA